ncbi:MAG TPA: DUF6036 family nucleotidyltransferase [Candidatus Paceibacterota bacterium]
MKELTKNDIEKYLEEINTRLKNEDNYGDIIIAGGAALTMVYNARNSTHDIDAIFSPKEDMNKIIKSMAEEYDINEDWLNDGVKGFLTREMTSSVYVKHSNLTVSSIDADALLALKLTSARAFSKDMDDSITLMKHLNIKDEAHLFAIIEKYISKDRQTAQSYFFTKETFQQYTNREMNVQVQKNDNQVSNNIKEAVKQLEKFSNISSIQYVTDFVTETPDLINRLEFLQKLNSMANGYIEKMEKLDIPLKVIENIKNIHVTGVYNEKHILLEVRNIFENIELKKENILKMPQQKEKSIEIEMER